MRQIRHPMSRAIYEFDDDFNVLVTTRDGRTGTFDPEMARWVGLGPREPMPVTANRRFMGAAKLLEKMPADRAAEEARAKALEERGRL